METPHYIKNCFKYHSVVADWKGPAPKSIVTLCGSTKFPKEFAAEDRRLSLAGHLVLSIGVFGQSFDLMTEQYLDSYSAKAMLDNLHKRKIDLSTRIHVIDTGGYIDTSTQNAITYAQSRSKIITYYSKVNYSEPA